MGHPWPFTGRHCTPASDRFASRLNQLVAVSLDKSVNLSDLRVPLHKKDDDNVCLTGLS